MKTVCNCIKIIRIIVGLPILLLGIKILPQEVIKGIVAKVQGLK